MRKENWTYKKLGEVCDVINGLWTGKKEPFVNVAVIRNTNFSKDCKLKLDDVAYIDVEAKQFASRKLQCGDIIIEKSGGSEKQPVGRPVLFDIVEGDYSFSNFTSTLRIKEGERISPKFLHICLYSYYVQGVTLKMQSKTTGLHNLDMKAFLQLQIPQLSHETQSRIVSELDLLQSIIDKQKVQLKELDNLAQAIFYDMFGDPVENEKGWEVKTLNSVGTVARGVSKHRPRNAPELLGDYMPFIQTGDIANSGMYITACQSGYSELGVEQSKIWHKGTLCITIAANIGKCSIMTFDACFPDSVVGFIADSSITSVEYVLYYFHCIQQTLEDNAMGVAQKIINLGILNVMKIPVPPLPIQQSFAQKVEFIERQKELINQSIREAQTLLDSRMEYYFGE